MNLNFAGRILTATFAAGMLFAFPTEARRISEKDASMAAGKFLTARKSMYRKAPAMASAKAVYAPSLRGEALYYVFNNADADGFTIVSGDDELPLVLGFTTSGSFDADNIPANVKYWLDEYKREIEYFYQTGKGARIITGDSQQKIGPLLTTNWDQTRPYNNMCPEVSGALSVTGCVATAMAQNLNFYEWPPRGEGERNGINFAETEYDYANMLDVYRGSYTDVEADAVATLMRHCGAAVDMNYSPSASGATDQMIHYALINHFRYNPGTRLVFRDYMSVKDWESLIYNELKNNGPVIMCGQANGGGHCFNVDGYQGGGYFHLNWGWGGAYDGYFLLFALNPDGGGTGSFAGGYNSMQSAIVDMSPAGVNDTPMQTGLHCNAPVQFNVSKQELVPLSSSALFYNAIGITQTVQMGVVLEDDTDASKIFYSTPSEPEELPSYYGYKAIGVELPEDVVIPDGKYRIYAYSLNHAGKIDIVKTPVHVAAYDLVNVKEGKIVSRESAPYQRTSNLIATRIDGVGDIHVGASITAMVTIANVDGPDYKDKVTIKIADADGKDVASGSASAVVPAGYSRAIDITVAIPESVEPGQYTLKVVMPSGKVIAKRNVEIKQVSEMTPGEDAKVVVSAITPSTISVGSSYSPIVTFKNTTEKIITFHANFYLYDSELNEVFRGKTNPIKVSRSETLNILINFGNLDLEAGKYFWRVYIEEARAEYFASSLIPFNVLAKGVREGDIVYDRLLDDDGVSLGEVEGGVYADDVVIPETVGDGLRFTRIDGSALTYADRVTSVTIPASVEEIGNGAFYHAAALRQLTFTGQTPPVMGSDVFSEEGYKNTLIFLPDGTANAYKQTAGWENVFLPSWTFNIESTLSVDGIDIAAPYYVGAGEKLKLNVSGNAGEEMTAFCALSDGSMDIIKSHDTFELPALGLLNGRVSICKSTSGLSEILGDITADVYSLQGILVKRAATPADVASLPAGIYIYGGRKLAIK